MFYAHITAMTYPFQSIAPVYGLVVTSIKLLFFNISCF